ncbi:MAG: carbohydrate ABC transporter permease [Planctomycetota bacterium]|nr:carbohydrate ABC transporter permease [Planctomycetota bacterium]
MRLIRNLIGFVLVVALALMVLFPAAWTLMGSFKHLKDIVTTEAKFIFTPTLENYATIFSSVDIYKGVVNSLIISGVATLLGVIFGLPAAYALSKFKTKRTPDIMFFILSLRFMPPVAIAIPWISVWLNLNLFDTRVAVIVTYLITSISTIAWMAVAAFDRVSPQIEEAAYVDGYGQYEIFWRVSLPVAFKSLLGAVAYAFVVVWNELMIGLILTSSRSTTLPVVAAGYTSMGKEIPWGVLNAATVILAIPPILVLGLIAQFMSSVFKHRGSGVKG